MEDFLIEAKISKRVNLSNIVEVIAHTMGLDVTLNEGYQENDYNKRDLELMYLSKTFDINKPIEKGNFAYYSSVLQGEIDNKIKIYRKADRSEVLVFIEDKIGQKNIFKEILPVFGNMKKVKVKTTDAYSLFVMRKLVDFFGGELKVLGETVNVVSEKNAIFNVSQDYYNMLNFTKSKHGFDLSDEDTYKTKELKKKANKAIELISNSYNDKEMEYTKAILNLKAPTLKDAEHYETHIKNLSSQRIRKIAENSENNNHILVCNWEKLMEELTKEKRVISDLTREEKKYNSQERDKKVKRRVR